MAAILLMRPSPHTAQQMYDLVADVGQYSDFVPYCTASCVRDVTPQPDGTSVMQADLDICYKIIREHYTSQIVLDPTDLTINVVQVSGPFKKLDNRWQFEPSQTGCDIHFLLDFDFRLSFLRHFATPMTGAAVEKFIRAFETRADILYGT